MRVEKNPSKRPAIGWSAAPMQAGWCTVLLALTTVGCSGNQPVASRDPIDLAAMCQPAAAAAVASQLSSTVTVREIENGPKFVGGTKFVAATDELPAYCQITGRFVTNPQTGKTANFLATLPANWNGKYLQLGCFGHCGFFALNDAVSPLGTITNQGYPLQSLIKGYASFGTDEGHMGRAAGGWAIKEDGQIDEDALQDFYYRATQVLARVGKEFTAAFYAQRAPAPRKVARSYFSGCSGGGRDAMVAASYFPEEFDGIIAGSPAYDLMSISFQAAGGALAALRSEDADVLPELMRRIDPIVKAQCDKLDGVEDGLIQNPAACDFEPERDLPLCGDDGAKGTCFTQAQIETVSTLVTAVTDERGVVVQPGFAVGELQYALRRATRPTDLAALDPWPDSDIYNDSSDSLWPLANANLKIFAHRNDPKFHTRSIIDFGAGGPGDIDGYRIIVPRTEVNLAIATARMGIGKFPENAAKLIAQDRKLLIWHNLSDELLTPYMSINYYKGLAKLHGGYENLQKNVRLFAIPGSTHCSINGVGPNNFDALTAIEEWVEQGKAPDALIARLYDPKSPLIDVKKKPLRTMPLCKFPTMARYSGSGDVNDAANWTCPAGDTSMLEVGSSGRRAGVIE